MEEITAQNLAYSLESLDKTSWDDFETVEQFADYVRFYNEMLQAIRQYAEENNIKYFFEKLKELPPLSVTDFHEQRSRGLLAALWFYKRNSDLEDKLDCITAIANSLIFVLQNPAMIDIINSAKQTP
jgi:hypothetical protein